MSAWGGEKPRTGVAVFEPLRERLRLALSGLGDVLCPCALPAGAVRWLSALRIFSVDEKGKIAYEKKK